MKKKLLSIILALVIVASLVPVTASASRETFVRVDGAWVWFQGQDPSVIVDGRTLTPARVVFEAAGFEVTWDGPTQTAVMANEDYEIRITIGSATFTTNGVAHTLDVPAQIINGRTMIPIRLPLESAGFGVIWDARNRIIHVSSPHEGKRFFLGYFDKP